MCNLRNKSLKGAFRRIRRRLVIFWFLPAALLESAMQGRSLTLQGWCRLLHPGQSKALDAKFHREIKWWMPNKSTPKSPTDSEMLLRRAIEAMKELTEELKRQRSKRRRCSIVAVRAGLSSQDLSGRKKRNRQKSPT